MPVSNFTPAFNYTEIVHYNQSYIVANQLGVQMTTPVVYIVFSFLGMGLLLLSVMDIADTCNDLSGILASLILFISTIQSFAVDTVTGFGATGISDSGLHTFVLMENHTIYHYDLWGVALGIIFVISLANLYRLWIDYHRITNLELPGMNKNGTKGAGSSGRSPRPGRTNKSEEASELTEE